MMCHFHFLNFLFRVMQSVIRYCVFHITQDILSPSVTFPRKCSYHHYTRKFPVTPDFVSPEKNWNQRGKIRNGKPGFEANFLAHIFVDAKL